MVSTHKRRPHVVATQVSKTTAESSGSQTITTKWEPHLIVGHADSGTVIGARYMCAKNGSGTMLYCTVGIRATNVLHKSTTSLSVSDNSGNGWSATIAYTSRGYTITWTKSGSGLNANFLFVAIRAYKCWYQQCTRTTSDSTGSVNYTGAGFTPDVTFGFISSSGSNPGIGWGRDITNDHQNSCCIRESGTDYIPQCLGIATQGGSPYNGWIAEVEPISDGFTAYWTKWNSGATVQMETWSIKFADCDSGYYSGVPVNNTDILSGLGYTPLASYTGSRFGGSFTGDCSGIQGGANSSCLSAYGWRVYNCHPGDTRRSGTNTSNYYAVDHVYSSGKVTESVSTTGSPGSGSSPYQTALALGPNSGLGGVQ